MHEQGSIPVALVLSTDSFKSAFFKRALKGLFHVVIAKDSFSGVDFLKGSQAGLIIIDEKSLSNTWMILAEHVRNLTGYREIPILLITNNLKKSFLVNALNVGISDFINEPFDADEIYQRILVATQSKPVTKKISLMAKRFKKSSPVLNKQLLHHRFVITEEAIKEIATVQKNHQSLCLLLIEVDNFNKTVEEIGDDGSKLIAYLKPLFKTHQRRFDILLPQGGGRFLMMLPKTSYQAAVVIAETLRQEAELKPFNFKNHAIPFSISIGIVTLDENPSSKSAYDQFGALLKKVDKALVKAKHNEKKIASE